MLSFSKIVTLTAVACGVLTQAIPISPRDAGIVVRVPDAPLPSSANTPTLKSVFDNLLVQLKGAVEPLSSLKDRGASAVPIAEPVIKNISTILEDAVRIVEAMAITPVDDILKGTDEVLLTLSDVVDLVYSVLNVVFEALGLIVEVVGDLTELLDILPIVIKLVGQLLQAVVDITNVVFENKLVAALQTVLSVPAITLVLGTLKSSPIALH